MHIGNMRSSQHLWMHYGPMTSYEADWNRWSTHLIIGLNWMDLNCVCHFRADQTETTLSKWLRKTFQSNSYHNSGRGTQRRAQHEAMPMTTKASCIMETCISPTVTNQLWRWDCLSKQEKKIGITTLPKKQTLIRAIYCFRWLALEERWSFQ